MTEIGESQHAMLKILELVREHGDEEDLQSFFTFYVMQRVLNNALDEGLISFEWAMEQSDKETKEVLSDD